MKMKQKDLRIAVVIGIVTGIVWAPVVAGVAGKPHGIAWFAAGIILTPLIFIAGLFLGDLLSRWKSFFYPFAKYVMVGFLNTGIDFAIFDLLIFLTAIDRGPAIALFKAIGFAAGLINSYFWNKHWAFEAKSSMGKTREFLTFAGITTIGIALNVGLTTLIANAIHAPFGLTQFAWDNVAAAIATVSNLVWNFVGYHFFVFTTHAESDKTLLTA